MRVISVDPGKSTGWAFWNGLEFKSGQVADGYQGFWEWWDTGDFWIPRRVVCESFIISAATIRKTVNYDALSIIGGLQYQDCQRHIDLVLQPPAIQAQLKGGANAVLKEVGWFRTGKQIGFPDANDANSAARHLYHFMLLNDPEALKRLRANNS